VDADPSNTRLLDQGVVGVAPRVDAQDPLRSVLLNGTRSNPYCERFESARCFCGGSLTSGRDSPLRSHMVGCGDTPGVAMVRR
jgi:hypothetical protein